MSDGFPAHFETLLCKTGRWSADRPFGQTAWGFISILQSDSETLRTGVGKHALVECARNVIITFLSTILYNRSSLFLDNSMVELEIQPSIHRNHLCVHQKPHLSSLQSCNHSPCIRPTSRSTSLRYIQEVRISQSSMHTITDEFH